MSESEQMCKKRIYEMVNVWADTDQKKWRKHSLLSKTDSSVVTYIA